MTTKIGKVYQNQTGNKLAGHSDDNENKTAWLQTKEGRVKVVSKRLSHSACHWKREDNK
jgi:hypothetical protein